MKVLIVDDNPDVLDLFADLIGDQYQVIPASNGQEAVDIMEKNKDIFVILTDIQMPIMNGFEMCRKIRKLAPLSIVIGFTGEYGVSTAFQARDAGFDDIFTKPIDPDELFFVIEQAFKKVNRWTAQ